jgi:hypothetical protein
MFLQDTHISFKLLSYEIYCKYDMWLAHYCPITGVSADNPLVAFYDIQGREVEVLFTLSNASPLL